MTFFEILLEFFMWFTSEQKKERYLKHNSYPKKDKIFIGYDGSVSRIIGSDTYKNTVEMLKNIKIKK